MILDQIRKSEESFKEDIGFDASKNGQVYSDGKLIYGGKRFDYLFEGQQKNGNLIKRKDATPTDKHNGKISLIFLIFNSIQLKQ